MEKFSVRLKEAMKNNGLSQTDLANKTGIPRTTISSYVRGVYEPKTDGVYILAKALGVSEAWLIGFDVVAARQDVQLKSDKIASLVARMRKDDKFLDMVSQIAELNESEFALVSRMIDGLFQKAKDDEQ